MAAAEVTSTEVAAAKPAAEMTAAKAATAKAATAKAVSRSICGGESGRDGSGADQKSGGDVAKRAIRHD
jgi:hypothetical protein